MRDLESCQGTLRGGAVEFGSTFIHTRSLYESHFLGFHWQPKRLASALLPFSLFTLYF